MTASRRPRLRAAALFNALLLLPFVAGAQGRGAAAPAEPEGIPRTTMETSGYSAYTSHADMLTFLRAVQRTSTEMRIGTYGESWEGRELPYSIFSRPAITQPWEAAALGKPVIVLAAGVHGGERTLRESLMIYTRELATPGTPANRLLDDVVIIVVSQINPDGFSAERGATRGNLWGLDLNRDYIKLEQPEIASYVSNIIQHWSPHLFVDGHNGGSYPYNINYQCPSHAAPDQRITELCDKEIFPAIDRKLATAGFKSFYYTGGNATRWNVGGSEARIGRNYGGFINSVGILFESPGQSMEDGVKSGVLAYAAVAEYAQANRARLMSVVETARRETVEQGSVPRGEVIVRQRYGPEPWPVTYEIAEGPREAATVRTVRTIRSDSLMKRPIPTLTRPRAWAYIIPRDAREAVALLRRHNITVEQLQEPVTVDLSAYTMTGVDYEVAYNHAAAAVVRVGEVTSISRTLPKGTYIVRTGQVLGRLAEHMLEPESTDNVFYWNTMDAWLPKGQLARAAVASAAAGDDPDDAPQQRGGPQGPPLVPIFKLMTPTPLAVKLVE